MSDRPTPKPRPKVQRWIWALLVLSLGANLAVAGAFAGRALRSDPVDPELGRYYSRVVSILPEERRPAARSVLLAGGSAPERHAAFRGDIVRATEAVTAALTAEPFDPSALRTALSARMDVFRARFSGRQDRVVALAETLSLQERTMLADTLRKRTERRMKRWAGR
ncbi:MAG: periplasmic heavy metal sensor [Pseudomonadota bacterium]